MCRDGLANHIDLCSDSAAKAKLGRISSKVYGDDVEIPSGPFGQVPCRGDRSSNWKFAIVGCGSNGFGQIYVDGKTTHNKLFFLNILS
jgi:hypothetical protein